MDTKQPITLFIVAVLVASVFSVVGIASLPLQKASAQAVTIETSVDELGGTFFGEGAVQIIIEDATTDDDNDDTITVTIEADGGATVTDTFDINDTTDGSQRFEFFLVHVDSGLNDPLILDGIRDPPVIVTFGDGGDLDTGDELFEDISFEIRYGNQEVTIDYEEVAGILDLDRDVFGSTSFIYIIINDQDANLNPTDRDEFTVAAADLATGADALFEITGGNFPDDVTFEETGDNTAVFEGRLRLNSTDTGGASPELVFTSDSLTLQLNDKAEYTDVTGGNNTSTDTSEVSFQIDDSDGEIDNIGQLTFGTELKVTVRDNDQNIDSDDEDRIEDALRVVVDATGGDSEFIDLEETGDNTGVFEIALANSELRITFLADGLAPNLGNGILELRAADIEEDLIISYLDPLDDDSEESTVAQLRRALNLTPGQLSAPAEASVTDEVTVTLTEPDLNDNPRTRDAYTILLTGASPFDLTRGGQDFADIYTFEIEVDGTPVDFDTEDVSVTLRETGINTGIFEFEIDIEDIEDLGDEGGPLPLSDGDRIEITINDFMADVADADEDEVRITIGRPSAGIEVSRSNVPIPPEPGSATATEVGTDVIVVLTIVDPTLGELPNVEENIDVVFGEAGEDAQTMTLEIEGGGVNTLTIESDAEFTAAEIVDDVDLADVLDVGQLEETGPNTGVFEVELTFTGDADMDARDWHDSQFIFTWTDDGLDDDSVGFTFRGSDGIVTVDQGSVVTGTTLTITVEDQDLNLDEDTVERFEADDTTNLVRIETEDETIEDIANCGISSQDFEETGENTGVFVAEFVIGEDIDVSCLDGDEVEVASNIVITYEDEIDSAGGGGDDIEVNVPVVSATGSIQVSPDLVGPATEITVLIVDADLNSDATSTDDYDADDPTDDDFFVSFTSSRSEVRAGSPNIEETGPNTGVFMFTLELITDGVDCGDDDLSATKYRANGGNNPSIGACPGDLIAIRYTDSSTGSGGSSSVSQVVEVNSWDPEFVADRDNYNVGDRVIITISDPDANRNSDIADSLREIRVTSDSDRVGEEFSAVETGADTGVFRLNFGTTSGTAGGSISVKQGDDITIDYEDLFPADFVEEEDSKNFLFTVSVGGGGDIDSTTVTPPVPQDPTGQVLDEVSAGQQVVLTTSVRNNNAQPQDFVALIEVRDSSGITVYLAWQTGTLPANGQTQVGLSWTPEFTDDYTVRTFVISDLNQPRVLSPVSESEITVS